MNNFDEIKQKAKDTMETIADKSVELYKIAEEKTKVLAKTTKLSTEIALEKGSLRKLYRELGKMYYELNGSSPETSFSQICTEIAFSLGCIAAKQKEIDDLKNDYEFSYDMDADDDEDLDTDVEIIIEEFEKPIQPAKTEPVDLDENTAEAENANQNPPEFKL